MYNSVNGPIKNNIVNNSTENVSAGPSINEKDPAQNEEWRVVQLKNKETGTMQWRQRLNILNGTAGDESGSNSFSVDIHLVAYGVAKQVTGVQLSHFLQERGLNVLSCDLLTKYENARSLAYKISIRSCDYEKAQDPEIWPLRVGVRLFKYFKK